MSQFLMAASLWLHTVATVIFIGYYLLLALIHLPALANPESAKTCGLILRDVSKRSRLWLYASMLIYLVTGIYLTLVDPNYLGIGNFSNSWSLLMLIKHMLILVMIGIGFWFNVFLRVGPLMSSNSGAVQAAARFRVYVNAMAVSGVLVLLLTAISQVL